MIQTKMKGKNEKGVLPQSSLLKNQPSMKLNTGSTLKQEDATKTHDDE